MKDESIVSTQRLRIALYDFGSNFDRRALRRCSETFPAVEVLEEAYLRTVLEKEGISESRLLQAGDRFDSYRWIRDVHLLILSFRVGQTNYLRIVNFLGRHVSTVVLDIHSPTCRDILKPQRLVVVDSHPPIADVFVDNRPIGEAPVWTWLRDGSYQVGCKLPGQVFGPLTLKVPQDTDVICQRQNIQSKTENTDNDTDMGGEQKAGAVLIYIIGAAAAAMAIILPILVF